MDTIKIRIPITNKVELIDCLKTCENYCSHTHRNGNTTITAKFKNLKVKLTEKYLLIEGSIAKFINSTNRYQFNPKDTAKMINILSDFFGIDFGYAIVLRIDYSNNIFLDYPISEYLSLFRESSTSKRFSISNETVYLKSYNRVLSFYDKIEEMKSNNCEIDDSFTGRNLMRIELRLMKNLPRFFDIPTLTFQMLTEDWCLNKLNDLWATEVLNARVVHKYVANLDYSNIKAFTISLAAHGLEAVGGVEIISQNINDEPTLNALQRYRFNEKLKEIDFKNASVTSKQLLEELYDKVNFIASVAA